MKIQVQKEPNLNLTPQFYYFLQLMDEVAKLKKFGEYVYSENERLIQQNILDKKIGNQLVSRRPGAGGKQLTYNISMKVV